jgi:hypothetical protein
MIANIPNDPLPYSMLTIVDVSPFRSPVRPAAGSKPRVSTWAPRAATAGLLAGIVLFGAARAGVGDRQAIAPDAGFRLAPGHAMPAALAADGADASGFRLAPGNAVPPLLVSAEDGVADAGFRLAPGNAMPADLAR